MSEERFVYCKTCGAWDKAWCCGYHNKAKEKQKRWRRLTVDNKVYFGYRLIPCIENKHHIFQAALTKLQLIRKLKENKNGSPLRTSNRLSRISVDY